LKNMTVSIVCITYNHAPYIRQCLDGFVMQKTSFSFEVLIHDDASTDGTTEIVREYCEKYPDIFVPFYEEENQWGKIDSWKDILFPRVRGKYVALCEGDDYWTDTLKLQKQVDAMERRPEVAVCFHPVTVRWEGGSAPESLFPSRKERFDKTELCLDDLLKRNFIQTNSVLYRWRFHTDSLDLIPQGILPGDWFMHLLHAQTGKILFLDEVMAVYRRHAGGIWTGAGQSKAWFRRSSIPHLRFYQAMEKTFGVDRSADKHILMAQSYAFALRDREAEWLKKLQEAWPMDTKELQCSTLELLWLRIRILLASGEEKKRLKLRKRIVKSCLRIFNEN